MYYFAFRDCLSDILSLIALHYRLRSVVVVRVIHHFGHHFQVNASRLSTCLVLLPGWMASGYGHDHTNYELVTDFIIRLSQTFSARFGSGSVDTPTHILWTPIHIILYPF